MSKKYDFEFEDYSSPEDDKDYFEEDYDFVKEVDVVWYNPLTWFSWLTNRMILHWERVSDSLRLIVLHFIVESIVVGVSAWVSILNSGEMRGWIFLLSTTIGWLLVMDMLFILIIYRLKAQTR